MKILKVSISLPGKKVLTGHLPGSGTQSGPNADSTRKERALDHLPFKVRSKKTAEVGAVAQPDQWHINPLAFDGGPPRAAAPSRANAPSSGKRYSHQNDIAFGDQGAASLKGKSISHLELGGSNINDAGIKSWAGSPLLKSVKTLDLDNNNLGTECAEVLAQSNLRDLKIVANNLGAAGAKLLASLHSLKTLDISLNSIGVEGAKALAHSNTLHTLSVFHNHIGDEGATALAGSKTLKTLDAGSNDIGNKGARELAKALKREGNSITSLNISGNPIDSNHRKRLQKAASENGVSLTI